MSILFSGRRRWSAWCITLALLVAVGAPARAQSPGYGPPPGYGPAYAGEPTSFGPAQNYQQASAEMAAPGMPSTPQAPPPQMGPPGAGPMAPSGGIPSLAQIMGFPGAAGVGGSGGSGGCAPGGDTAPLGGSCGCCPTLSTPNVIGDFYGTMRARRIFVPQTLTVNSSGVALFPSPTPLAVGTFTFQSLGPNPIDNTLTFVGTAPPGFNQVVLATPIAGGTAFNIVDINGRTYTLIAAGPTTTNNILIGNVIQQFITSPTGGTIAIPAVPGVFTLTQFLNVLRAINVYDPVVEHGAFRIAENESPRPRDRIFGTYNYLSNVRGTGGVANPSTQSQAVPTDQLIPFAEQLSGLPLIDPTTGLPLTQPVIVTSANQTFVLPRGAAVSNVALSAVHAEVFGFEKTVCCDCFSFGLRAPILQTHADGSIDQRSFGDMSLIFKFAPYICGDNVVSGGYMITLPTGQAIQTVAGPIHDVLSQPWAGYIFNCGDWYIQGFESAILPSDKRDVKLLCTDLAIGYYLWRDEDCFCTMIAPTIEFHLTNALNHRGRATNSQIVYAPGATQFPSVGFPIVGGNVVDNNTDGIIGHDIFDLTGGVNIGLGSAVMTIGISAPMTGGKLYDYQLIGQLNLYF